MYQLESMKRDRDPDGTISFGNQIEKEKQSEVSSCGGRRETAERRESE